MNAGGLKKLIFSGAIILLSTPLFVFAQENTFTLKEKQSLDLLNIIRQYPLSTAQFDLYYDSIYYPNSDNSIKTGAVMLVKQAILQSELDYWFVKMPVEFSKRFIKAVYKLLPLVAYGDFSGAVDLIEKYTVEQANNYVHNWLKQNQTQIGSGIGKYSFPSYKGNWQTINIPYIIVYSPIGVNKAKIVVEFYSQKAIEPPQDRGGAGSLGGNQEYAQSTVWPWDIWITSKYNKNDKIEPFIVRVKGQVIKDKYGNFSWDKTAEAPAVEVEFGKPVPEIDQSDIILTGLQANQSQGFLKDKINKIKQTAQEIVNQIKDFFAIFKPQAHISSFVDNTDFPTPEVGKLPDLGGRELESIAEQVVTEENASTIYEDLLKIKAGLEQAIKEKQAELDQILLDRLTIENTTTTIISSASSGQATTTLCSQAIAQEPAFDKVIFNEVAWMGTIKSASDEWIELKNISIRPVDLNGWQIFNKSQGLKIFFTTTTIVEAGGFWLLERTNDDTVPNIKANYIYTGALANTDERLYLVGPNCVLQDRIIASPYWQEGDNTTKETMERNQFYGWQTSSVVGGTPKATNSIGKRKSFGGGGSGGSGNNNQLLIINNQNTTSTATSTGSATSTNSATSTSSGQATTSTATSTQQATTTQNATTSQQTAATSTQQATSTVFVTSSTEVLIVEVQIESTSSKSDDFIKLFNQSTTTAADISGWQLKKCNSSGNEESIKKFTSRQYLIQPQESFLWMNSSFALTTTTKPNATTTQKISGDNSVALFNAVDEIVDQVAWGSSTNPFVEGFAFAENPTEEQNLVRKYSVMNQQYQDTGDNSVDFALSELATSSATSTSSGQATSTQAEDFPGITNLMAIPSTERGAVDLFWTCPTSASAYIIKKSEQEISTSSWDTAETISQNIAPKPIGEIEFLQTGILSTNKKFYFAIRYIGLSGQGSLISDSVSVKAWQGFQDNSDGTLTDLRTGLAWLKDASSSINNFGASSTQDNAVNFITGQNSDWRLPNFKELASLFNYSFPTPGVESGFENIKLEKYWSKSKRLVNMFPIRYSAWPFDFSNGKVEGDTYTYEGGENSALYSFMATKNQGIPGGLENDNFDFTDNNDGTVKDNKTGLIWLNATLAQTISNRKNWDSAFLFASNAVLCNDGTLQGTALVAGDCSSNGGARYDDWRLPNVQELMEITKVDNNAGPRILPSLSWNVSYYWTGTMFDENNVWYVGDGICFGSVLYRSKTGEEFNVQLVRE